MWIKIGQNATWCSGVLRKSTTRKKQKGENTKKKTKTKKQKGKREKIKEKKEDKKFNEKSVPKLTFSSGREEGFRSKIKVSQTTLFPETDSNLTSFHVCRHIKVIQVSRCGISEDFSKFSDIY